MKMNRTDAELFADDFMNTFWEEISNDIAEMVPDEDDELYGVDPADLGSICEKAPAMHRRVIDFYQDNQDELRALADLMQVSATDLGGRAYLDARGHGVGLWDSYAFHESGRLAAEYLGRELSYRLERYIKHLEYSLSADGHVHVELSERAEVTA